MVKSQRTAGGEIAVWNRRLNGLSRAGLKERFQQGLSGTRPVIKRERMFVRAGVVVRQIEWYRDYKVTYNRLKQKCLGLFLWFCSYAGYVEMNQKAGKRV